MKTSSNFVQSPIGNNKLDCTGSAVGAARMNPVPAYLAVSDLLQEYINNSNESAWERISGIIDNVYITVSSALDDLDKEAPFSPEIIRQVKTGKKLLFKVNLVALPLIDYHTHGLNVRGANTQWEFTAAVMRWFHDRLGITYHQMIVGEAGTTAATSEETVSRLTGGHVTREAIMEGKFPGGYGGWGFYFARKYLADCHDLNHADDPMNGYQESLEGFDLPPGKITDKLMVYDFNVVNETNGREVPVLNGENFQTITMHKVIVGGNPANPQDLRDWPGCVIVNLPKLKVHMSENFTCAVKNLGMGLYSMEVNESKEPGKIKWKYGAPDLKTPTFKLKLPHTRWSLETDMDTLMPLRDKDGNYIWKKTGGIQATMADAIQAVKGQGIMMFHVADAIEITNIHTSGPEGVPTPEGFVFASADPVALDVCASRYLFSMVPMAEVDEVQRKYNIKSGVIQIVPMPMLEGKNIVTGQGYDSSFSRYHAMKYCEERGLGQRKFYVVGKDLWYRGRLASLNQCLGRVENGIFTQLLTTTMYHAPRKPLKDLQSTVFAYLELNDKLTGSDFKQQILELYDENGDGVIDYMENGKGTSAYLMALQANLMRQKIDPAQLAKLRFLMTMTQAKLSKKEWNTEGYNLGSGFMLAQAVSSAWEMSQVKEESPDSLYPGRQWGNGKWPSLQYVLRQAQYIRIYGHAFPDRIDVFMSPFGQAFYYADVKYNGSKYCTAEAMKRREDVIARYLKDIAGGAKPLPFTIYIPIGLKTCGSRTLPNVEETDDPGLVFTASFAGKEAWRELRLSEYNLI